MLSPDLIRILGLHHVDIEPHGKGHGYGEEGGRERRKLSLR
jgi:hypothetical protein